MSSPRVRFVALVTMAMMALPLTAMADVLVESVRVRPSPERTRIVFDLAGPVQHKTFTLSNPRRLVIDVTDAKLGASFDRLDLSRTPIRRIRSGNRAGGDLRVVLDLKSPVKPRSFVLTPILQYGDRLVVDLYTPDQQVAPVVKPPDRIAREMRDAVIAIDAGHGGDDPGAVGPGKLYEKDVVLGIAQRLHERLEKEPGFRSVLVRTGDYYVKHDRRTLIARQNLADIFVSVHADAFRTPEASGASVYAISLKGATSETAQWLAEKENRSDLIGGVENVSLNDKDDLLVEVLLDLSMTASLAMSLDVGKEVMNSLGKVTKLHKKRVEQAAFAVLKSPDIPSILVETGFISNPGEARKLARADYQDKLAEAIFNGIVRYMKDNPPEGSYLAWRRQEQNRPAEGGAAAGLQVTYKIERGDTLSGIASRHRVSAKAIRELNGLKSDRIRIGQILKIPAT